MSLSAKGHGKVIPDSIRIVIIIITKVVYKNTQGEAWKRFYFYLKLTIPSAIGNFSCHPGNKICPRFVNIDFSNTHFSIDIRYI